MLDKQLLDILACPKCKNTIFQEKDKLICKNCKKAYPVREGIPVLLIEEARDIN